uniref:Splicing factor, arginine/serine-rich, putative n=1 Tax=Arundo donax TaxID=35708 RepID=A0A0A9CTH1_ARUDO
MKHILGAEDQGHDQDLDRLPILDVMAVAYMLKAVIGASQSLQRLNTLLNLEVQMPQVSRKLQGSLRLHLPYELTYLTGRETRLLIFANIHWAIFSLLELFVTVRVFKS